MHQFNLKGRYWVAMKHLLSKGYLHVWVDPDKAAPFAGRFAASGSLHSLLEYLTPADGVRSCSFSFAASREG